MIAALTRPYSNGPTEGVNTKTKLIARQCMSGHASCSYVTTFSSDDRPDRMGFQWADAGNSGTFVVTPPAGTTITGTPRPGEQATPGPLRNCTPGKAGAKSYTCDINSTSFRPGEPVTQEFTMRIHPVVPGARGSVRAAENPEHPNRDHDAANDTAAITVKTTDSATTSPSPNSSASPSATATASPSGSGSGTSSATTTGDGLAATAAH